MLRDDKVSVLEEITLSSCRPLTLSSSDSWLLTHNTMKIGILLSRVRVEEKWLFEALEKRGLAYDRLDDREVKFDLAHPGAWLDYNVVLERSLSYGRGLYACHVLNSWGIPTVNSAQVAATCGDKLANFA